MGVLLPRTSDRCVPWTCLLRNMAASFLREGKREGTGTDAIPLGSGGVLTGKAGKDILEKSLFHIEEKNGKMSVTQGGEELPVRAA